MAPLHTTQGCFRRNTGDEEESKVCLRHVQPEMPTRHPSEDVTWINESGFQVKTENKKRRVLKVY